MASVGRIMSVFLKYIPPEYSSFFLFLKENIYSPHAHAHPHPHPHPHMYMHMHMQIHAQMRSILQNELLPYRSLAEDPELLLKCSEHMCAEAPGALWTRFTVSYNLYVSGGNPMLIPSANA